MKLLVESDNGHDIINVPNNPVDIQQAVEKQLQDNKWVTLEKQDGSSELLTAKDMPYPDNDKDDDDYEEDEEESLDDIDLNDVAKKSDDVEKWKDAFNKKKPTVTTKQKEEWENKFENIKSACATHKTKGG